MPSQIFVRSTGEADIVAHGPNNSLMYYHAMPGAPWGSGVAVPGPGTISPPSIFVRSTGEADIVAQAPDGSLWYYYAMPGSPWNSTRVAGPGTTFSAPSIFVRSTGEADIVAQGPEFSLVYYYATPGSPWNSAQVAGPLTTLSAPSIFVRSTGEADIVATGADNSLVYYDATPGGPWGSSVVMEGFNFAQMSWGPWGTGSLSDSSSTAGTDGNKCQYQVSLSISQNGICTFSGYYENRGDVWWGTAPPQSFIVAMFVFDNAGKCYTFAYPGNVPSAPQPGSVAEWNITQNCPVIAQNWDSIVARSYTVGYYYNNYSESFWQWLGTDVASALNWLIQNGPAIVQDAENVVEGIITIGAALAAPVPPPPLPAGAPTGAAAGASGEGSAAPATPAETATLAGT